MKKGTLVRWTLPVGNEIFYGRVIADEIDGHVFVAKDAKIGYEHAVIYCAVTWLTTVQG